MDIKPWYKQRATWAMICAALTTVGGVLQGTLNPVEGIIAVGVLAQNYFNRSGVTTAISNLSQKSSDQ